MILKIEIDTDNDAFGVTPEDWYQEVRKILIGTVAGITQTEIAAALRGDVHLYDSNGNKVGRAWTEKIA